MDAPASTADDELSAILLDQAGRLFEQHVTGDVLSASERGEWPAALWEVVKSAGFASALVPEERGGTGLAVVDAMRLVRLSAYHALPLPLAETMIARRLWSDAGGETGEGVMTLAPASDGIAVRRDGDVRLDGRVARVPWGRSGRVLLSVPLPGGEAGLALVDRDGASIRHGRNLASEPRDDLAFEGLALEPERLRPGSAVGLAPYGALIRAQQMVGAMQRALDLALAYANLRVQFGRPIGKFQAVQHMLAVAAGHLAVATAAADQVVEAFEGADFGFRVALAKARCSEAAGEVAAITHQVHGAIGFTQEHALHRSTRRLWSWRDEFGSEAEWHEVIGRHVCRVGGESLWPLVLGEAPDAAHSTRGPGYAF